jgi:HlyD family secretion protein
MRAKQVELQERQVAAEDQLKRTDLRSPQSGVVHELAVHTVGGVIEAGEQVMLIVPDNEALSIELHLRPSDIDQISIGQKAALRFTALNQSTTPEVHGTVTRLGADLTREVSTGQSYFVARVGVDAGELAKLKMSKLVPGMPVEAYIETGQRTALSYLMKPFTDQWGRAFREN